MRIREASPDDAESVIALFQLLYQAYWNQGVGRSLLGAIEGWAKTRGLHRLELTVQATNDRAIMLYEGIGFVREGTKRDSIKIGAGYVDEFFMSKLIDEELGL